MVKVFKNEAAQNSSATSSAKATLVISFYKNTRMLDLVLASLHHQTFKNFNLIVTDDGSPAEVVSHVHTQLQRISIPSWHLWHEDIGFRKNRILNWAIHHCQTELMIFIDQDCVLHPEFIAEHVQNIEPGTVLCGRRINLTPTASQALTPEKVKSGYIEKNIWWMMLVGMFMKDNNGIKGLYFKNPWLRKMANKKYRSIVGCNFSAYRRDLLAINGFDTRYEGAGFGEDSDVDFRMGLIGIKMKPACNTAVQYHIYHKLLDRSSPNEKLYNDIVKEKKARTEFGLSEQLKEAGL